MIDIELSPANYLTDEPQQVALQSYVRALLARQHALDDLETVQQQINQVWATIRQLVEAKNDGRATSAASLSRAAEAIRARHIYNTLERRRELGIAALHQAERRANSALQSMLASRVQRQARANADFRTHSRARSTNRLITKNKRKSTCQGKV
jgi:hypothetical protein